MTAGVRPALPFAAVALFLSAAVLPAADPAPDASPAKTVMVTPGKLLLADDLAGSLGKDWKVGKGKWEADGGAVRGAELKADMHGAVARRPVAMTDAVVAFSFRLDGAKQISLSLNGPKGHVGRVVVRPTGFTVQKDDQDGKTGPDRAAVLDTVATAVTPGAWHTLVVEFRGPDLLATLDGASTAFGSHPALATGKANLGLTVAGESAAFKALRVWAAAGASPGWDAARAGLLERKKK